MTDICLCFEVHQPFRLKKDFFWKRRMFQGTEDTFKYYFSDVDNREVFSRVAGKCYFPTNQIFLDKLDEFQELKVSFSLSGVFMEQCERYDPDLLESFRQLAETGRVEFLDQTYYHSLVSLYEDPGEFREQVAMHRRAVKDLLGYQPEVFENTELIYNNRIAALVEEMGYKAVFTEGLERVLGWRSPNHVYKPRGGSKLKVLMRNYKLTDDVGFRFSSRDWEEYPLTADKYASWLASTPGEVINIFADYETFGEHHWQDTGIQEFLKALPGEVLKWENLSFATPSEVVRKYEPRGEIDVFEVGGTISWADLERDLSCWLGNTMQQASYHYHKDLYEKVKRHKDFLRIWRYLGVSDHYYYMFTAGGGPGEVHSYFSPYGSPYDSFITYLSVLMDLDARVAAATVRASDPFVFSAGEDVFLETAWSLADFCHILETVDIRAIRFHMERGDFENWVRHSLGDERLARKIGKLDPEKLGDRELRKKLVKICRKGL
ncbi:MAG: alpha-amylase [Euryarchaeota archaeon]|nr:alpha-amylase [Euryarchaeota archaeon]